MPKKKVKAQPSIEEDEVPEMREIEPSDGDVVSYVDSGHISDVLSQQTKVEDSSDGRYYILLLLM